MLDACDKEQPSAETGGASGPDDLQSRGSIQYATRVKPDANGSGNDNIVQEAPAKKRDDGSMPMVPAALEEHLRNDFPRLRPVDPTTLYAYAGQDNRTYGGAVPFYMPKAHYGSPRPVSAPSSPALYGHLAAPVFHDASHDFNNFRPVRQHPVPAAAQHHYHAVQLPADAVQRPVIPRQHHQQNTMAFRQQSVAVKHGHRVQSGKRLPPNGARHSVVYKKPLYKFGSGGSNGIPHPTAASHYGPASPVPAPLLQSYPITGQLMQSYAVPAQSYQVPVQSSQPSPYLGVHSGNFQQQPQPFVHAQQQHHLQQPLTSMSQSVSVSYSTAAAASKHHPRSQQPIQSRQETFGQPPQHNQQQPFLQGGFNPSTVVVEGGFKPIVPGVDGMQPVSLQDRSDRTTDDLDAETARPEKKMSKKLVSRKLTAKHHASNDGYAPEEPRVDVTEPVLAERLTSPIAVDTVAAESGHTAAIVVS